MSQKPVVPRELARQDVEGAVNHYATEARGQIALKFIDAVENAYRVIASHPATGSLR